MNETNNHNKNIYQKVKCQNCNKRIIIMKLIVVEIEIKCKSTKVNLNHEFNLIQHLNVRWFYKLD